ncbi:hypothetical protein M5D96_003234 [Drosophila gunungcola]|uniref:Uncharacterized protein n=1 Tax=Drosophila gunungcola TaxID=103775 RepID=A0A9P9YS79_9MUSC|nr:hypothetical protein M5D96_003234 [Drosophila gunungcola]
MHTSGMETWRSCNSLHSKDNPFKSVPDSLGSLKSSGTDYVTNLFWQLEKVGDKVILITPQSYYLEDLDSLHTH